ncbi:hypothetical protein [Streptosporangium sp. NPDC023615]|uniref:hypothetical protein n=1 Tax=Streptosporangium sp. NPDC023615 TaxID=3154794 RepID=UPI00341593E9
MGDHLTHDRSIREHEQEVTVVPTREQPGSVDPATWRVVPGDGNDDAKEGGTWAITGGDGDENALYLEVLDAERPREVAELIVETMTGRARRSRLEGALAEVERERLRRQAEDDVLDPSNPHLVEVAKLAALVERVGEVGRELNRDRFHTGREELDEHLYERLTQVAATSVAWMESILARNAQNARNIAFPRDLGDPYDARDA